MNNTIKDFDENKRIINWNKERNMIKTPDELNPHKEMSFIVEEVIEGITDLNSEQAREGAQLIVDIIKSNNLKELKNLISENNLNLDNKYKYNNDRFIDALCDIRVFTVGAITKAGYDVDTAMIETIKEIESRKGSIKNGKFVKDKSPEAQAKWYKADYNKAKIK